MIWISRTSQADRVAQNKKESKTARLQLVLVQMFPIFLRDSAPLPISKKMGCIFLINHLFKLSFYVRLELRSYVSDRVALECAFLLCFLLDHAP